MTSTDSYTVTQLDTEGLSGSDSADLWTELTRLNHGTLLLQFADPATFGGLTVVQDYAGRQLTHFRSDGIVYSRTGKDVRCDDDDGLRLIGSSAGPLNVRQNGIAVHVEADCTALVTKARPFDLDYTPWTQAWVISLPARALPFDPASGPALLDLRHGLGSVVNGMVTRLWEQRNAVEGPEFSLVCDRIVEMLDLCMRSTAGLPSTLATVDAAFRDYVRRHAADPDLTPAAIAGKLGWSLRQVQYALRHNGTTPSELLRSARLDLARSMLRDATTPHTIAEIAHASGFRSLSTFGASFRERFGQTPKQARTAMTRGVRTSRNPGEHRRRGRTRPPWGNQC